MRSERLEARGWLGTTNVLFLKSLNLKQRKEQSNIVSLIPNIVTQENEINEHER